MNKYICSICGYIYDEAAGDPKSNLQPGTLWKDVPKEWKCPLCQADKSAFNEVSDETSSSTPTQSIVPIILPDQVSYSMGELSAIFSNFAKGWDKQYAPEISQLCLDIADYYQSQNSVESSGEISQLKELVSHDLDTLFPSINQIAANPPDRGSLRALKWAEQVTRMSKSHLENYISKPTDYTKDSNIYVCEICGFIYIGDDKPEICPVCKVPNIKMTTIERGA